MTESSATHLPRRILTVTALCVLAPPHASRAGTLDQAMETCAQAFIAASLPKEQPVVVEKQDRGTESLDRRAAPIG